jgi:hypothetical protein
VRNHVATMSDSAMKNPELAVDAGKIGSVARFLDH